MVTDNVVATHPAPVSQGALDPSREANCSPFGFCRRSDLPPTAGESNIAAANGGFGSAGVDGGDADSDVDGGDGGSVF